MRRGAGEVVARIRRKLGIDGAVAYTFLARLMSIAGSTGTVLLIARFLSPVEQGYYYTLLSLVALQMVFELGFSFVIQQLAAHECARLKLHADGTVTGDAEAHARLASTLQRSVQWYTVAAVAMFLVLAPLGVLFFQHRAAAGAPRVAWLGPWMCAVIASAVGLWCLPFFSFLEGCGQIRAVAALRLRQSMATMFLAWTAMVLHHGLYSPALVILGQAGIGLFFLFARRSFLMGLMRHPVGYGGIEWGREVWPFQWRIAISWLCAYFTVQAFIPLLFAIRGPVEAGQMGMSLSITSYMGSLVLPWITTKATPFGRMVAEGQFVELDRLFRRTLRQALAVFGLIAVGVCAGAFCLPYLAPRLSARVVAAPLFVVLVLGSGANCVVQSAAVLLRSFKREPFVAQSLVVSALTMGLAFLTAPRWGTAGAAGSYLIANAAFALPSAMAIFLRVRRRFLNQSCIAAGGRELIDLRTSQPVGPGC
jgi:O-antigen/teichoic acid export membrane protein